MDNLTTLLMNKQMLQKKIKTPPLHKKNLNCYCHNTFGTFVFAATAQANPKAKAKEPNFPTLLFLRLRFFLSWITFFVVK